MKLPRDWVWRVMIVLCLGFAVTGFVRTLMDKSDFTGLHLAARTLVRTGDFSQAGEVERYMPVMQVLLAPLGWLPLWAAAALWQALNLAALAALPARLCGLSGVSLENQRAAWLAASPFILDNLLLGQSGPVLLLLVIQALVWTRRGLAMRGGVLLGLAGMFKVIPAVFFAVPLLRRRRVGVLVGGLGIVALTMGVTVLVVGPGGTARQFREWFVESQAQSPWEQVRHGHSLRYNNQGVGVTLARTLADPPVPHAKGAVRWPVLPLHTIWTIYGVFVFVMLAAWLACIVRAGRLEDDLAWGTSAGLTALVMLAVSPLVWTHYFIWLLPGLVALRRPRVALCLGVAGMLAMLSPSARALGAHTLLSLVLLVLLAVEVWRVRPAGTVPGSDSERGRR